MALSPDKAEDAAALAAREGSGPATTYSDSAMDAARAFGVSYRVDDGMFAKLKSYGIDLIGASGRNHRQLPVPSVFVASETGKILFTYVNPDYSVRLAPEVLLAVAKSGGRYNPRTAAKKRAGK